MLDRCGIEEVLLICAFHLQDVCIHLISLGCSLLWVIVLTVYLTEELEETSSNAY